MNRRNRTPIHRPALLGCVVATAAGIAVPASDAAVRHSGAQASAAAVQVQSATLTPLHALDSSTDGVLPGPMSAGADGNFYGVMRAGGSTGYGGVYRVTANGAFSVLHAFKVNEGDGNDVALVRGPDGSLYGSTAQQYGTVTNGTIVFRIGPAGKYSAVYHFPADGSQGSDPAQLVVGADGTIFGTSGHGGATGNGIAFKISPQGQFTSLHDFSSDNGSGTNADGMLPHDPNLTADGSLVGLTAQGGSSFLGTVFKVAADGTFSVLTNFTDVSAGVQLLTGHDGNLYGASHASSGSSNTSGYVFQLTAAGQINKLYTAAVGIGATKVLGLLPGNDDNLYAVVENGTDADAIVRITPSGKHTVLHSFDQSSSEFTCKAPYGCFNNINNINLDGITSQLSQDSAGNLYGVATSGGATARGTLYRLAPDGTFTLLFSFSPTVGVGAYTLTPAADGSLLGVISPDTRGEQTIYRLLPNGPLSVSASFSPATAKPGTPVTLSWNSSGATACNLSTDIADASGPLATSGSMGVTPTSSFSVFPLSVHLSNDWIADILCSNAGGSVASYALRLPKY